MIKVERDTKYNTFYWPSKADVYDTMRDDLLKVKLFGITIYKRHKTWSAEYSEHGKNLGLRKLDNEK